MKTALLICLLPVAGLLTGCVGVVVPVPAGDTGYGKKISPQEVSFVVLGKTPLAEITTKIGDPSRDSVRVPALAYSWEEPATGLAWGWVFISPYGASAHNGGHVERSHWRAYFIEFDAGRIVRRAEFVNLSGGRSLDEQLEDWAKGERKSWLDTGGGVFNPNTGTPIIAETAFTVDKSAKH